MAHFDYIKPGGTWGLLSLVSSAILEQIDRRLYKTVNGDEGGVWAPTPTAIIIGGLGLQVTGPFAASNANITITTGKFLTVESGGTIAAQSGSIINLAGTTTISGPVTINNGVVVTSEADIELTDGELKITHPAALKIDGAATLSQTFLVAGGAGIGVANTGNVTWQDGAIANHQLGSTTTFALGSSLTINGTLAQGSGSVWTLNGTHNLGSTAVVTAHNSSAITISCKPTFEGGMTLGNTTKRNSTHQDNLRLIYANLAGATIAPQKDVVHILGPLGLHRQYQIADPSYTVTADECVFKYIFRDANADGSHAIILRADLSVIVTLKDSARMKAVVLVYSGVTARWELFSYTGTDGVDVILV
jgi:hypothetical protein